MVSKEGNRLGARGKGSRKIDLTQSDTSRGTRFMKTGKKRANFTVIYQDPWIHILGIESPGLTAAPALAQHVLKLIK